MKTAYFINFSNHPSNLWGEHQSKEAEKYGPILDLPFPQVDELGDEAYIGRLADEYVEIIMSHNPAAVLCQGEFCLAYAVIQRLKKKSILVLAACSKRIISECGNTKISEFEFARFRRYE